MLRATDIDKQFGITHAVDHVSIDFYHNEIHALIGENGSGKSTFTNMLTGIYSLGGGTFTLDGENVHAKNQVDANRHGIAIIVQETGTLSGLTVAENIFLGEEDPFISHGVKNTAAMNKKAQELLDSYGFGRIRAGAIIDTYNFEDRKLVEIVKATYFDPKVLVVDETTTALNHSGRVELFKHMRRLRDLGSCVIFISHDLDEVLEMSDRVSVLRDGEYIVAGKRVMSNQWLIPHYIKRIGGNFRFEAYESDSDDYVWYTGFNTKFRLTVYNASEIDGMDSNGGIA